MDMAINMICKKCNIEKTRVHHKKYDGKWKYCDEDKSVWNGQTCPQCTLESKRSPLSNSTAPTIIKGLESERVAAEFFESIGFNVERCNVHGPDLILDDEITVEVKSVTRADQKNTFKVGSIKKNRINDNIVALIHNGKVMIEDMKSYITHCDKSFGRSITKTIRREM
jgi:hypothetical protein